ncbi:MAG: class I SAM-dependent methyltransferase [Halobacteriota archaeon]
MKILNLGCGKRKMKKYDGFLEISYWDPVKITRENLKRGLLHSAKYAKGSLVDLGCGVKPYKAIFERVVEHYYGVDLKITAEKNYGEATKADLFADITNTGLRSESFDVVLSTQVLEHIPDPRKLIVEIARLLKDGGICIMTIPFVWQLHSEPYDFYRFTKWGIKELFENNGFDILELFPLEGVYATLKQTKTISLYLHLEKSNKLIELYRRIRNLLCIPLLNYLALKFDRFFINDKLCLNYLVIAEKDSHQK